MALRLVSFCMALAFFFLNTIAAISINPFLLFCLRSLFKRAKAIKGWFKCLLAKVPRDVPYGMQLWIVDFFLSLTCFIVFYTLQ